MGTTKALDRVAELEALIHQARHDYYNGEPTLPDGAFDVLVDELKGLKPDSPAVTSIGAPLPDDSAWPKVEHLHPMGSLDKVQTPEEIAAWLSKLVRSSSEEILSTEKLDGISIRVEYVDGEMVEAATRGDGLIGQKITSNVAKMKGVPALLKGKETVSLRGEIVLHKSDFDAHFPGKANPRNAASGTATRLDGVGCEHLSVYFYQVRGPEFEKDSEQFEWLEARGLRTPFWLVSKLEGPLVMWQKYQESQRELLDYLIDGLVIRINDLEYQESLGETHNRPKGAVAFKFTSVARESKVVGLELQVGGTGRVTPVAVVEPVQLMGSEVQRASLYNWAYIEKIGFHIGATVQITKANDVIPRVLSVTKKVGSTASSPTVCPDCGYELERDGEYIICPNTAECPAQVEGRLKKWVTELGIMEWGDSLIEKVVEADVTCVPGLYRLSQAKLASLDRMGPTSAKNAHTQLWSVLPLSLERLIGALGIPLCATSTMELVVGAGFDTLDKLTAASVDQLQKIPGMGPKRSKALVGWFQRNSALLKELFEVGITIKAKTVGTLTGKSFCFTGAMQNKRPVLENMVKEAGGQVKGSVGKGLSYLVIADPDSTSSKAQSARENGTTCISEEAFLAMVK